MTPNRYKWLRKWTPAQNSAPWNSHDHAAGKDYSGYVSSVHSRVSQLMREAEGDAVQDTASSLGEPSVKSGTAPLAIGAWTTNPFCEICFILLPKQYKKINQN